MTHESYVRELTEWRAKLEALKGASPPAPEMRFRTGQFMLTEEGVYIYDGRQSVRLDPEEVRELMAFLSLTFPQPNTEG